MHIGDYGPARNGDNWDPVTELLLPWMAADTISVVTGAERD